jgi:hypothetical protein
MDRFAKALMDDPLLDAFHHRRPPRWERGWPREQCAFAGDSCPPAKSRFMLASFLTSAAIRSYPQLSAAIRKNTTWPG